MKHALLIDDDDDEFLIMSDAINAADLPVRLTFLNDSRQVVSVFNEINPDIIFIDLNMPAMNGIECIEHMRENGIATPPFVIIYSTSISDNIRKTATALGVSGFIKKTNSVSELVSKLSEVFKVNS